MPRQPALRIAVVRTAAEAATHAPDPGTRLGLLLDSPTADPAGASLSALGTPGCSSWIGAFVASGVAIDRAPTRTAAVAIPAGVPPGASVHAMFAGLPQPGAADAYGASPSNGVTSVVNAS